MLAKRQYRQFTGREQTSDVIAYQVSQSSPGGGHGGGSLTASVWSLPNASLKGQHAYIGSCTHTDRRHIHNHILWNSTTLDCRGKFDNFWGSSRAVRALSDTRCIEQAVGRRGPEAPRQELQQSGFAEQRPSVPIDIQAKLPEGKGAGCGALGEGVQPQQMAQTINFLKENGT